MLHQSQFIEMFGNPNKNERNFDSYQAYELFDLQMGKTPDRSIQDYWTDGTFIWVSIGDMQEGMKYITDSKECITDIAVSKSGIKIVPKGTLLMSFKLTIGRVVFAHEDLYTNEAIMAFIDKKQVELSDQWLYQLLLQYNWLANASQAAKGKTLNKETIGNSVLFIPPMELQKNFASIVEQADKSKFDGFKSQFIEMFGTPDNHPAEYAVKNLGELSECYAGATPSTKVKEYWENGSISWMSSGEVHMGHVTETESKITESGYKHASTKMVPVHSVVIALAGQGKTRGTVAITEIPLCTNQSLCAIVPSKDIHYEYLYHNLKGRYLELRGMAGDVNGRGGLNLKIVQSIRVIVPPLSEQMRFVGIAQQADKSKYMD